MWTMLLSVTVFGQSSTTQVWISGHVMVTTSDSLTSTKVRVQGRMWRDGVPSGEHDVVFCIAHATPVESKLNYTGGGRVVYRTRPSEKSTAKRPRAEKMLPALGVLQADGESPFFLAEGQRYPHPPNERSVGRVSTFAVVSIVRQDVGDPTGQRENTEALSCAERRR